MLGRISFGLGLLHDPAQHAGEVAGELCMDFPAQVWLEVVLHRCEHELSVDGPYDVPLGEPLGACTTQLEVAPESTISGSAALAASLNEDGRQAQGLGELLQTIPEPEEELEEREDDDFREEKETGRHAMIRSHSEFLVGSHLKKNQFLRIS